MFSLSLSISGAGNRPPLPGLLKTFDYTAARDGLSLRSGGPTQGGYAAGAGTFTPRLNDKTDAKGGTLDTNGEYQWYADPAYSWSNGFTPFAVVDGKLRIRAQRYADAGFTDNGEIPDRPTTTDPYPFVSGILNTKHSFGQQGGYFECRCKFTSGKATWPAFWMLPVAGGQPPEIDVMESNGVNIDIWTGNAHSASPSVSSPQTYDFNEEVGAVFRTYAVDWTADTLTWYIDGVEVADEDISERPNLQAVMYMIVNMAIGSTVPTWVPAPDGTTPNPADLEIEYIRAWQRPGPNSLSLSATSILDDAAIGTAVGTLSATAYGGDEDFTYSILEDPENKFTIVGNELRIDQDVQWSTDASHPVRIQVADSAGRTWNKLFTINVTEAEPAGTNLYPSSTSIADAAWAVERTTKTSAGAADQRVMNTTATGNHALNHTYTKAASVRTYRVLFDVAGGLNRDWVKLAMWDSGFTAGVICNFNIATGEIGNNYNVGAFARVGTPVLALLPNGDYRIGFEFTTTTNTTLRTSLGIGEADEDIDYAGLTSQGIYIRKLWLFDIT
jgi:beta-glucanase (GH16 family)